MQVLVIDPVPERARCLENVLRETGHAIEVVNDLASLLDLPLDETPYDLAIADVASPVREGLAVVRALRRSNGRLPLILLTDADATQRARALDLGADDCLSEPFALEELRARIRALLRRGTAGRPALLRAADLAADPATHQAWRRTRDIRLTAREFALLECFLRNPGIVLTRPMLLDHVWGLGFHTESNVVDVYVGYLREKVDGPGEEPLLRTVRGVGYMLGSADPRVRQGVSAIRERAR